MYSILMKIQGIILLYTLIRVSPLSTVLGDIIIPYACSLGLSIKIRMIYRRYT